MMIVDLIYNLALLVALSIVSGFIDNRWRRTTPAGKVLQGLLFGGAAVVGMLRPFVFSAGLIFDGRSVMISLCGLFFGPWSAGIASLATISLRLWQGGPGAIMGVAVILSSAGLGWSFFWLWKQKTTEISASRLMLFGLLVHLAMLAMTVFLPSGMTLPVLNRIAGPVLLTYPLATVLIGKILSDQEARSRYLGALQKSEAKFRQLYDSLTDAVVSVDMDGRPVEFNQAFQNLLGYSPAELRTLTYRDLTPEHWHPVEEKIIQEKILPLGFSPVYEKEYRRRDGTIFPVELRTFLLRDEAGRPVGMWAIVRDITGRKRLEAELRQAQKMEAVGTLAGGIAHDFNNLLTVVLGQADLVMMEPGLTPRARESLNQILQSAERAANLTRQLLTFSRKQPIQPRLLDLNAVLSNLAQLLERIVGENIQMESRLHPGELPIRADMGMVEQTLINLAVNARDAMPRGGSLALETSLVTLDEQAASLNPGARPGSFARVSLKDTGEGIPPSVLPFIFDPFFTTKEVGRGTGLGLASAHAIVLQHEGWMEVDSQPGTGSTFCIYFPLAENAAGEGPGVSAVHLPRGGRETILVVEDEESLRKIVKLILAEYGYRILDAETGVAALAVWKANSEQIDLLLTDIVMPLGVSGLALAEQVRADRPLVKVMFITGYSPELQFGLKKFAGPYHLLQKPFTPAILAQAVRECLDYR